MNKRKKRLRDKSLVLYRAEIGKFILINDQAYLQVKAPENLTKEYSLVLEMIEVFAYEHLYK